MTPVLTLTMGIPGAGKTTWARAQAGVRHLATDPLRTNRSIYRVAYIAQLRRAAYAYLRAGDSVVIEACSVKAQDRAAWLRLAARAGASTRLAVVSVDLPTALARNARRGPTGVPPHIVAQYAAVMARNLTRLESEGWGEVLHVNGMPVESAG